MIRYALACDNGHDFETWFPSSASYDAQAERGLVTCALCGSSKVEKQLMAPSIGRKGGGRDGSAHPERQAGASEQDSGAPPEPSSVEPPVPVGSGGSAVALISERDMALRAMLRAVREHVMQNAEHVGAKFATEARRMHYGETEHRSIYGEASPVEARALAEEGIEFHAIPVLPDDRN